MSSAKLWNKLWIPWIPLLNSKCKIPSVGKIPAWLTYPIAGNRTKIRKSENGRFVPLFLGPYNIFLQHHLYGDRKGSRGWQCPEVLCQTLPLSLEQASVQFSSVAQLCLTLCNPMNRSMPDLPVHHQLPRVHSDSHPLSQWCHPTICRPLLFLPPIPPSIRVFSNESTLHMRWPKYWSFSFSIIPSKEIPGLISFRMDWLDFLAVHGTLKSLLQHHSLKASFLWWEQV